MAPSAVNGTPVVILNMHYSGLAIARDLWRPGRKIVGLSTDRRFPGNTSRFISFRLFPDTETEGERCKDFLLALAKEFGGDRALILPTRDHDVHFLMRYRDQLEKAFLIPYPETSKVEAVMDKAALSKVADSVSVYCPRYFEVVSSEELDKHRGALVYPSVLKPAVAASWRRAGIREIVMRKKAIKVNDYNELRAIYQEIEAHEPHAIVQEYIAGPETNLVVFGSYCNKNAEVVAYFTGRKVLQYPYDAGTGVAVYGCLIPEIVEPSVRLLEKLGYSGISEIEYKYDQVNKRYALIEINARHWDQHGLGTAVGVNLSEALYQDLCGNSALKVRQSDKKVCWIADDSFLRAFFSNLKERNQSWALYLDILKARKTLAVFRIADPMPAINMAKWWLGDIFVRAYRFVTRRRV
jgi:predicted ATP-grasp superfamily ATP-dependent carboligase